MKTPDGKSLVSSKEVWFNVIAGLLQVADWAAGTGLIPLPYGPPIQAIVTILIRVFLTKEPITSVLPEA